ncbi:MAG: hypothetical protein K940chlam8_00741 [Chlamydiae bacterium]|nr:hypothetical protein [Chlamydiota bacterium]
MFFQLLEQDHFFLYAFLFALGLSIPIFGLFAFFVCLLFVFEAIYQIYTTPFYSKKAFLLFGFILCGFFYGTSSLSFPKNASFAAICKIASIQPAKRGYFYKAHIKKGYDLRGNPVKNMPITFFKHTLLEDVIFCKGAYNEGRCKLKECVAFSKNTTIKTRFLMKKKVLNRLNSLFEKDVAHLFSALFLGWNLDPTLYLSFLKCGQGHLLAISGLHFAFFAMLLLLSFKFLPKKWALVITFAILTLYFLFLGPSPSIQRAYVTCVFYFLFQFFNVRISGLNVLGIALLLELVLHPMHLQSLGFQFSYGICFFLIVFFKPIREKIGDRLKLPSKHTLQHYSTKDLVGIFLLTKIRDLFALTLCIQMVTFPLILFYFNEVSLLYLIYNLFFPFLILICMMLGLFTLLTGLFGNVCSFFTSQVLDLLLYYPSGFDLRFSYPMPLVLLLSYFVLLFLLLKKDYRLQPFLRLSKNVLLKLQDRWILWQFRTKY